MDIKLLEFDKHGDERGTLIALEQNRNIPFEIKRVYYMYETDKYAIRGAMHIGNYNRYLFAFMVHAKCFWMMEKKTSN